MVALCITIASAIGAFAIAANEAKQKLSEYDQAIVNMSRIAELAVANQARIDNADFLKVWWKEHGEDSTTIANWSIYPRHAPKKKDGSIILNVLYLDSELLPEKGVLKMHTTPDSSKTIQTLWDYPIKK